MEELGGVRYLSEEEGTPDHACHPSVDLIWGRVAVKTTASPSPTYPTLAAFQSISTSTSPTTTTSVVSVDFVLYRKRIS